MLSAKSRVVYYGIHRDGKRFVEVCVTREDGRQVSCVRTGRSWATQAEAIRANEEINRPFAKSPAEIAVMLEAEKAI